MGHPFGDLISQYLHRKHGLSQAKLAEGILQAPTVISGMCKGRRLTGPQARERVVAIIGWLQTQGALTTADEANALLAAAGMSPLSARTPDEASLIQRLSAHEPQQVVSVGMHHRTEAAHLLAPHNNLPAQPTSFVGREIELAQIAERLADPHCRLLTLVGPGGVGKTRLALQAAATCLTDFVDGVFVVFLATIREPGHVLPAIAQTLDLQDAGQRPLLEIVKIALRERHLLLVLDNFEHVLAAAPVISELLATCPRLKVLVTSRASLHLRGEHEYLTRPLPVPDPAAPVSQPLFSYPSIELFRQRAQASRQDFALNRDNALAVATICARLDGLPLAIELAAARVKIFSPQVLLKRLDADGSHSSRQLLKADTHDAPIRHRSLWETIAWSYDLLDTREKALFRKLAVFIGGWTMEAAEFVCDQGLSVSILDGLSSLVDKSLVQWQEQSSDEPRFTMLEVMREFGLEQLQQHNELAVIQQRYADYYTESTLALAPQMQSPQSPQALATLRGEYANIRATLRWLLTQRDVSSCMRMCDVLHHVWTLGSLQEADGYLNETLALAVENPPSVEYVNTLANAGLIAYCLGDSQRARTYMERCLDMNRVLKRAVPSDTIGMAQGILAWLLFDLGDYATAQAYLQASLTDAKAAGDQWTVAMALVNIGHMATRLGDATHAGHVLEEGLAMHRAIGQKPSIAAALYFLGYWCVQEGHFEKARSILGECLALAEEIQSSPRQAQAKRTLAWLALEEFDYTKAAACFKESLTRWHQAGQQRDIIETLEPMVRLALAMGQPQRALTLAAATTAHRRRLELALPPLAKAMLDQVITAVRHRLGPVLADAAWATGERMALDEAVAYALYEIASEATMLDQAVALVRNNL